MATNNNGIGWTRILYNGSYTFINHATGGNYDPKGFDQHGYNKLGLDREGNEMSDTYRRWYEANTMAV